MKYAYFIALFLILSVELALIVVTYVVLRGKNYERIESFQQAKANTIVSFINARMRDFYYLNQRNAAYLSLHGRPWVPFSDYMTMIQLHEFSHSELIESCNFVPVVTAENVPAFNSWCSKDFGPTCNVKRIIPGANISVTSMYPYENETIIANTTYYPVIYAYPTSLTSNAVRHALGLNLNSSTFDGGRLLHQMSHSRESNTSILTGRLMLARQLKKNPSGNFAVYITFPARYSNSTLMGYANIAVRISALYDGAIDFANVPRKEVSVMLFELTASIEYSVLYEEAYQSYRCLADVPNSVLHKSVVFHFTNFNRRYTLLLLFSEKYQKTAKNTNVYYIPLALAAAILILNITIFILLRWYSNAMQTREIKALHKNTNDLLAYTHHELRNPLNVISGLVGFHIERLDDIIANWNTGTSLELIKEALHDMKVANSSCKFMEHIVNDVLIIQKLEQHVLKINEEMVNVHALFTEIKDSMRQKIEEYKALSLIIECPVDMQLYTDPFRLRQIMTNFVSNAIKYTTRGTITLYAWTAVDGIKALGCRDTGRGIQEVHKHLIFKSHVQLNHRDIDRHGSNGLGLYLSKLLADRLSGRIGFTSILGQGSDFYVQFDCEN